MDARETVDSYYDALRDGDSLGPFFAAGQAGDDDFVKFGLSETLVGIDDIEAGLAEQTETTTGWTVDSRALRVTERERHAWFSDDVFLAWTDTDRGIRFEFDTRWSGTLERRTDDGDDRDDSTDGADGAGELGVGSPNWRFVGMHVSTAEDL